MKIGDYLTGGDLGGPPLPRNPKEAAEAIVKDLREVVANDFLAPLTR